MIQVKVQLLLLGMLIRRSRKDRNRLRAIVSAILFGLLQLQPSHAQPSTAISAAPDPSGLSEAMVAMQFSHMKLWFAGKFQNWKLATYELDQIAANLDRSARRFPAGATPDQVAKQVASLRDSIAAKDVSAFTRAYAELTAGCNTCHRAAGREFIGVQTPSISPFTDQDFTDQVAEGRKLAHTICGICHVVPGKANTPLGFSFSAPSFVEITRRPSFTEADLRQLLTSNHRRVGPEQAMPNPRLNDNQIEHIVAYFEALRAGQTR